MDAVAFRHDRAAAETLARLHPASRPIRTLDQLRAYLAEVGLVLEEPLGGAVRQRNPGIPQSAHEAMRRFLDGRLTYLVSGSSIRVMTHDDALANWEKRLAEPAK
jgi:hypothetical protein